MTSWLEWLLGIKAPPEWVRGPDTQWHLEFQSLPQGMAAAAAVAAGVLAVAIIWLLYRAEGRSLGLGKRLALGALRGLILTCVVFMLLELVVVITKRELVPSRLLVLVDTSQSMDLADPYSDESSAREAATRIGLVTSTGEADVPKLRATNRLD
ncbi:MAG TPA: hypothetical protein VF306_15660, partial [Pirellulales bacterium]